MLRACDQVANSFTFNIHNDPIETVLDFETSIDSDGLVIFGGSEELNGRFPGGILEGRNWGTNDFDLSFFILGINSQNFEVACDAFGFCSSVNLEVVEFGGIGELITFRITGINDDSQNFEINVTDVLIER